MHLLIAAITLRLHPDLATFKKQHKAKDAAQRNCTLEKGT